MDKRLNKLSGRALQLCQRYPNNQHTKAVLKLVRSAKKAEQWQVPVIAQMALDELRYLRG